MDQITITINTEFPQTVAAFMKKEVLFLDSHGYIKAYMITENKVWKEGSADAKAALNAIIADCEREENIYKYKVRTKAAITRIKARALEMLAKVDYGRR